MRTGYTKLLFAACLGCTAYNLAAAQKAPTSSIPTVSATSIQLRSVNTDVSGRAAGHQRAVTHQYCVSGPAS